MPISGCNELFLHQNKISVLHSDSFAGLSNVVTLTLHNNLISRLPEDVFTPLTSCESLQLNNNFIKILPKSIFHGMQKLTYLSLENNQISHFQANQVSSLVSLTEFSLWNNHLSLINATAFAGHENLRSLQLGKNRISKLQPGVFTPLKSVQMISLFGNNLTSLQPGGSIETGLFCFISFVTELYQATISWVFSTFAEVFEGILRPFQLALSDPMETDVKLWNCHSLCWMKRKVNITWYADSERRSYKPKCADIYSWDQMNCHSKCKFSSRKDQHAVMLSDSLLL